MNNPKARILAAAWSVLCATALAIPNLAHAVPVSVQMGFNSFQGFVGSDNFQFETFFDEGSGPYQVCPDTGCGSGIGEANIPFTSPRPNQLEFWTTDFGVERTHNFLRFESSGEQDVELGEEFLLGLLTFSNGVWFTDPEFEVSFFSTARNAQFNNQLWNDTLHLSITTNAITNTDDQNADYIHLLGMPQLGSVRAYELGNTTAGTNSVTVELYGMINSLDLTRFANPTGGGFIDPSITDEPTPNDVPVPGTLALLVVGLVPIWLARRRQMSIRA